MVNYEGPLNFSKIEPSEKIPMVLILVDAYNSNDSDKSLEELELAMESLGIKQVYRGKALINSMNFINNKKYDKKIVTFGFTGGI